MDKKPKSNKKAMTAGELMEILAQDADYQRAQAEREAKIARRVAEPRSADVLGDQAGS